MHNPMAKALAIMLFMSQALIIKLRSLNYQILDSYLGPVQHLSHHHIIGGAMIIHAFIYGLIIIVWAFGLILKY